jgi:DNA-binding transcriptional LysR family regulator
MKFDDIKISNDEVGAPMDLRHLRTFQAVLREGSFRAAATALRLAQPTVTLHIQELEERLGLELFDRRGKRRGRTPAGDLLASRVLPILDALEALERSAEELRDGRSGLLRIASIEPAASRRLAPLLARLRVRRPALRVKLEVGGTAGVGRAVANGEADVGICSAPPTELDLRFEPLFSEEMALLLPKGHRLARARRLRARDLEGEPMLLTEQGCFYRQAVESALRRRGVEVEWALECGSTETLRCSVRHGLGLAILPRLGVSPAPPGTVVRRFDDVKLALPVGLATRRGAAPASPALAALVAELRREVTARPGRSSRRAARTP